MLLSLVTSGQSVMTATSYVGFHHAEPLEAARSTSRCLSPVVEASYASSGMTDGRLEGIVLKDRTWTYRDGTWFGWSNVKDRTWYEREARRFDRR